MTCKYCNSGNCYKHEDETEYQEFIPNKEYAVGEFFKIHKKVFKVIEDSTHPCEDCDFYVESICEDMICSVQQRTNEDSVQFILYDTLEENE